MSNRERERGTKIIGAPHLSAKCRTKINFVDISHADVARLGHRSVHPQNPSGRSLLPRSLHSSRGERVYRAPYSASHKFDPRALLQDTLQTTNVKILPNFSVITKHKKTSKKNSKDILFHFLFLLFFFCANKKLLQRALFIIAFFNVSWCSSNIPRFLSQLLVENFSPSAAPHTQLKILACALHN